MLPRDMFYTTDISVTLWILSMNKHECVRNGRGLRDRSGEVLFVDLRTWDQNIEKYQLDKNKTKKKVVLTPEQIAKVKGIFESWQDLDGGYADVPELCKSVRVKSVDPDEPTISSNEYSLAPSRYIEFIDHDMDIDYKREISRIQSEMHVLLDDERTSHAMLENAFEGIGYGIQ